MYQISDGDEKAFTALYAQYVPQLASFIRGITGSERMVNEIIQETFLQIWIGRDKLARVEAPKAWTFRIAANITYNHLKRLVVERKAISIIQEETADVTDDVTNTVIANSLLAALHKAIDNLSPQRRKIYRLSREEGMTIPEIAAATGLSVNTVRNTLSSSLESIRAFLAAEGYAVPLVILMMIGM